MRAISACPCAWSLMSACTYKASDGNDSATAVPAATEDDELTTTRHPSSDSLRAMASPMPLDEPVTIATLPSSSPIVLPAHIGRAAA